MVVVVRWFGSAVAFRLVLKHPNYLEWLQQFLSPNCVLRKSPWLQPVAVLECGCFAYVWWILELSSTVVNSCLFLMYNFKPLIVVQSVLLPRF